MQGVFTVKFYTEFDMTTPEFEGQLGAMLDFTTISHYELED